MFAETKRSTSQRDGFFGPVRAGSENEMIQGMQTNGDAVNIIVIMNSHRIKIDTLFTDIVRTFLIHINTYATEFG